MIDVMDTPIYLIALDESCNVMRYVNYTKVLGCHSNVMALDR